MFKTLAILIFPLLLACNDKQDIIKSIEANKQLIKEKQAQDDRLYKATMHNPVPFGEVFNRRVTLKTEIDSLKSLNDSLQATLSK